MDWKGVERRRFPRIELACTIQIHSTQATVKTTTQNIGLGGVRVFLEKEIKRGTPLALEIVDPNGRVIKSSGYTVWVAKREDLKAQGDATFDTGIQFDHISEPDKQHISHLIDTTLKAESQENNI